MTYEVREIANARSFDDKFEIYINGVFFSTHPTRRGAEKLGEKFSK